jgi:hypothetical protein
MEDSTAMQDAVGVLLMVLLLLLVLILLYIPVRSPKGCCRRSREA